MQELKDLNVKIHNAKFNVFNPNNGNSYTVSLDDGYISCNCRGFEFCIEPKTCKHCKAVLDIIYKAI